jgi:predicted TIM-barrel fold metal-dependent hydrolase
MASRRSFLTGLSLAALAAGVARPGRAQQVSNSSGAERPRHAAPPLAADCHMHIYDAARFPMPPSKRMPPSNATVAHYRALQKRIGTTRVVVVQPRNYAIDNRVTLDAISQLGPNARGIAVLHPTVTDAELAELERGGIRGIRFTLGDPATAVVKVDMIEPLAKRIVDRGWHIQFNLEGEQIVEMAELLRRLPTQMVFDHLGNPTLPAGIDHPSHRIVRELVDKGRAWVKLSGAYSNSKVGPPSYPEATRTAKAFVKAAPERLVWGSDWPHPTMPEDNKPDDALLFDLLSEWAPDAETRERILVKNPEKLYGFSS